VDVGRTEIRVVQRANAHEPDGGTGLRVVAPNRDPTGGAAGDLLAPAACRRRHDDFGLTSGVHDTIGFIKSVERMRGSGLALAPTAMTRMNDQWCSDQTKSDLPARASTFHVQLHRGGSSSRLIIAPVGVIAEPETADHKLIFRTLADVRFGALAYIAAPLKNVRFTPESGQFLELTPTQSGTQTS
jgi:hypothetical protein